MKVEHLEDTFNRFLSNNSRAILIDGPWGVGKTHNILSFLKKNKQEKKKNNNKIVYISLFGKSNLDEVHTEIYSKLCPIKAGANKAINIIPKIVSVVPHVKEAIGGLEFSLKINTDSKMRKPNAIIILDDFERLNFDKIVFNEILGYFNSLIIQQIKIIVVCNENEIIKSNEATKDSFFSFKEKIFDREYKISATNIEVIESYFDKNSSLLDENILKEFNNNLRIASRVAVFFNEIKKMLTSHNEDYYKILSDKVILWYATFTIIGANTTKYAELCYQAPNDKKGIDEYLIDSEVEDERVKIIIKSINNYVNVNKEKTLPYFNISMATALFDLYYFDEGAKLRHIFSRKEAVDNNPFPYNAFYLSDEGKTELFKKQYQFIIDRGNLQNNRLYESIREMCTYSKFSEIDAREDKIIEAIVEQRKLLEKEIYRLIDFGFGNNFRLDVFAKKLKKKFYESLVQELIDALNNAKNNSEHESIMECFGTIETKTFCLQASDNYKVLNKSIYGALRANNYFIDNLFDEIDDSSWRIAHKIVDIAIRFRFTKDVIGYIESLAFDKNVSAKERYSFLKDKLSDIVQS